MNSNDYYSVAVSNCLSEFESLFTKNKFISKKVFDKFLDKYQDVFKMFNSNRSVLSLDNQNKMLQIINNGYNMIKNYNTYFINNALITYKDYFDNMFKEIDSNILLDNYQRKAIVSDEDYSLVIAGAGSGKTTVIAAKVKYLVDKLKVDPRKIIVLAYTNKAKDELSLRINNDFNLNIEVLTFHKLGISILRELTDKPLQIIDDNKMIAILNSYIKEVVFENKSLLKEFIDAFKSKVNFQDEAFSYPTFKEYYKFYMQEKYHKEKDNLLEVVKNKIDRRLRYNRTINGEYVKSLGEVRIANFLYRNNIPYHYEEVYPYNLFNKASYSPDFTIDVNGKKTYIEFYGLTKYNEDGNYTLDDINYYNRLVEKKRELHHKYNTDLIELYSEYDDGTDYIDKLREELEKRNIKLIEKSLDEVYFRILETSTDTIFFKATKIIRLFINKFKASNLTLKDFDKLITSADNEIVVKQLKFIRKVYCYYNDYIHSRYQIDFQDMINYAYKKLSLLKPKKIEYDYIFVDEYQDISYQRYNFIKELSTLFNAKIVAVGDDYQSIYSFSLADMSLFTNFYELMGYADILKIINTYRNSQELVDVAYTFISKNYYQIDKRLITKKHLKNPVVINYYDNNLDSAKIEVILKDTILDIYKNNPRDKILLLGRYNKDIDYFYDVSLFKKGDGDHVILKDNKNIDITYLTIHKSKGLGFDQVIILNTINAKRGFPSMIKDEPVISLLSKEKCEPILYPEERRLFYVALTRTKNKVYILCPYSYKERSSFIKEIVEYDNVVERYSNGQIEII